MKRTRSIPIAAFSAFALSACAAEQAQHTDVDGEDSTNVASLTEDLSLGSEGSEVRAVQEYLTQFGYLPNQDLAGRYPAWRPLVNSEIAEWGAFDEVTEEAVRELQRHAGLSETGIVDARTRELLQHGRCGEPDGIATLDPSNKFDIDGPWSSRSISWRLTNTNDVTTAQAKAAVAAAFATWAAQTSITVSEVTSGEDITISFAALQTDGRADGKGKTLARASFPVNGGNMTIDTAETWSVAATTPAGSQDLQTVVLHELGHSLGIGHSSVAGATMFPFISGQDRALEADDITAISVLYDQWQVRPGGATDIALGSGSMWVIGSDTQPGGFGIHRWNGQSWDKAPGGAVRIAVDRLAIPWIVNSVGTIFRRTSGSAFSGTWEVMPGCAKDIGAGQDGSVWVIGCSAVPGGFAIHKWNGSNWDIVAGGATRIAVGPTGVPWLVNSVGSVFRRTSSSASTGSWGVISGPGSASDIGVGPNGDAWIVGFSPAPAGLPIFVWNEQAEELYSDGTVAAPERSRWIPVPGAATSISVGINGPCITNSAKSILCQRK